MKCRVCGSRMRIVDVVTNCRMEPFSLRDYPHRIKTVDMSIYKCFKCTHLQSENYLPDDFYEKYPADEGYNQYILDSATENIFTQRINTLNEYSMGGAFLEVGCGTGAFLELASDVFNYCVGIEPSAETSKIACLKGLNIINDYFGANLVLEKKFNCIAMLQVLEHLENLDEIVRCIYNSLSDGGIALINVPNGETILNNKLHHQVIAEHLNYFTPLSLITLIKKVGFELVALHDIKDWLELDLYIRKPSNSGRIQERVSFLESQLMKYCRECKNIVVWGAGAKSVSYANMLPEDMNIKHFVDNSVSKVGKYVSGIKKPVEMVTKAIIDSADVIIIFASSYNEKIISELENNYQYENKIVYFTESDVKCVVGGNYGNNV